MRNLTIRRAKRFVACLGTMNVYIEDPMANDLTINGVTCRKLGKLKNGQEATFAICEAAARVFVIADKLSKGFCNEYFSLPEGSEDIILTGKNCFNPATGNAFRFDGVTDPAVLENRKKGSQKGLVILIIAIVIGLMIGSIVGSIFAYNWFFGPSEPKEFAVDDMRITLTDDFIKIPAQNQDAAYTSKKGGEVTVMIMQEEFSTAPGSNSYSVKQYGQMVIQSNGLQASLKIQDGITYFEYEGSSGNNTFHYIATVFKGPDAFWLIQFGTETKNADALRDEIFAWAKTVTFE